MLSNDVGADAALSIVSTSQPNTSFIRAISGALHTTGEDDEVEHPRTGTFLSSWSVLANTILGIGLLGLPWAAAQVGWILSFVLLGAAAFWANFSLYLLSCVALEVGGRTTTFYSVCTTVAPHLRLFVDMAIAVKCFGVATSYLLVVAQTLLPMLDPCPKDMKVMRGLTIMACVLLVAPVCARRRLGKSTMTNWIALSCIFYVWCLFMVKSFVKATDSGDASDDVTTSMGPVGAINVLSTVPVYIFAFTCHQNMFPITNEIKDPSPRKLGGVATAAVSTALALYVAAATLGYAVYGSTVKENFLLALPDGPLVTAGRFFMAISNVLSFPLQCHPCRRSLTVLIGRVTGESYEYPEKGERMLRRYLTCAICIGTVIVATFVDDMGMVFSIIGTVGSNTICLIMPAYLYIKTFESNESSSVIMISMAKLQLLIGLIVLPSGLFSIFWKAIHGS